MSSIPTHRLRGGELRRPAVLVTSGAYNPVHANHLLYLDAARAFLEQPAPAGAVRGPERVDTSALEVVGGYICALPDRMVARRRAWWAWPAAPTSFGSCPRLPRASVRWTWRRSTT